jgi:multicomponent Na+:H+ antiporter subunit E
MKARDLTQFLLLLAFWLLLSGQYDPVFIGMGVGSAALVTALTRRLLEPTLGPDLGGLRAFPRRAWRFAVYITWLVGRIPPAGLQIAYHVLHPKVPIDPGVLRFRTGLQSPTARTILANSITLVPGTMTLEVDEDEFIVHAFIPSAADDLASAAMQNKIADLFLEEHDAAPHVVWEPYWRTQA